MGNPVFDAIAQEIERGEIDKGLWTEAFAVADGDENITKARYIQFRARQFKYQAQKSFSGYDLWTVFIWVFAVAFCGFAASGCLAAITFVSSERLEMAAVMTCFAMICALCSRALFLRVVTRFCTEKPTHTYLIIEFVAVACLAFILTQIGDSRRDDTTAAALAGAAISFVPYGFMAFVRAKQLRQMTAI